MPLWFSWMKSCVILALYEVGCVDHVWWTLTWMKKVVFTMFIDYKVYYQPHTIGQIKSEPWHEEGCIYKVQMPTYTLHRLVTWTWSDHHHCSCSSPKYKIFLKQVNILEISKIWPLPSLIEVWTSLSDKYPSLLSAAYRQKSLEKWKKQFKTEVS